MTIAACTTRRPCISVGRAFFIRRGDIGCAAASSTYLAKSVRLPDQIITIWFAMHAS